MRGGKLIILFKVKRKGGNGKGKECEEMFGDKRKFSNREGNVGGM